MKLLPNNIYHGDCMDLMKDIPDKSIDMILSDLPYGTTACKWDSILSLNRLWLLYRRILKDSCMCVLNGNGLFTNSLINSNVKYFKYRWVWVKGLSGNFLLAKNQPLRITEDILVFGNNKLKGRYFPLMRKGVKRIKGGAISGDVTGNVYNPSKVNNEYFPKDVLYFSNTDRKNSLHPTQKPVVLFEYLIKTYTKPNEIVLDSCIGSGTTGIACINTGRRYIGIEKDKEYYDISCKRVEEYKRLLKHKKRFEEVYR